MYTANTSHKHKKNQQQPHYFLAQTYSKWQKTCFQALYPLLLAQILFTATVQQVRAEQTTTLHRTDSPNAAGREYVAFSALEKQVGMIGIV